MVAKRALDLVLALLGLLLLAPLWLLIALAIKLDSPGPLLFRQERVGRHGRPFRIHKFRTMVADAPARGPAITVGEDARITRVGRWLRARRLDELPQLIDVLAGHMSLVGPRPEVPRYVALYPPALREAVLSVRPGLTDPASLERLDEAEHLARAADPEREYVEVLLPAKLEHAIAYALQATLASDLRVIGRTLWLLLGAPVKSEPPRTHEPPLHEPAGTARSMTPAGAPSLWHRLDRTLTRLRPYRERLSLAVDAVVVAACWNFTYLFRLGFERWWSARPDYDAWVMLGIVAAYLVAFRLTGIPSGMWRFAGFGEVRRLALACALAGAACGVAVPLAGLTQIPRAVLAVHPLVTLMGVCMVRLAYRMLYEHTQSRLSRGDGAPPRRAIVLGAGEAARLLLAGIHHQGWTVLGLLDDDPALRGARIADAPVLGTLADVARQDLRNGATHVIVALPGASAVQRRRALELAASSGLPVLTVPRADELREGRSTVERLRDIEPDDLLGREPVQLDEAGIGETLCGKTVLVTGAGGSIGSELCRQLAHYQPARLVLYELSEFNLYSVEQELGERFPQLPLVRLIGDVKDLEHLRRTFAKWQPQAVFHAAAFKHVPLMEEGDNAWAALRNNTLGTYHAALAAAEHGAERFVLISTDKAVNPTNVMGATKRAAELVLSALAAGHRATRFMAVRFGNVLGSSGSVIPKFKEQIARGGPVTVTHPEIIRYFMTIPEAARLVLQAAAIGESGQVLVLDMGEPVKIVELARELIRLAGHSPDEIGIEFAGLRPGEKLYEELLADADTTLPTRVQRLRVAQLSAGAAPALVSAWLAAVAAGEGTAAHAHADVRVRLRELVPEFSG